MASLFIALIHYPVVDRNGRVVTSAITSLDLHDLARSACTYGVSGFYVVHPVLEQREFAARVLDHWRLGYGRQFDSRRRDALALVTVVTDLDEAVAAIQSATGQPPALVYTSARAQNGMSYASLRKLIESKDAPPVLLMIGTGFGLAPSMGERADIVLAPIIGAGDYNHLSVRAATGAILDRLCGH